MADGFASDFRRFFLRGLATVLPTLLTVAIIIYVFGTAHQYIGQYINVGVLSALEWFWGSVLGAAVPENLATVWHDYFWWVGFVLAVVGIYIFGRFAASFIGRGIWRMTEQLLLRMPVIGAIYPHVKQVTDMLFAEKPLEFSRVVAVEYPRRGMWSLGLVTGAGMRVLQEPVESELLTLFVPSSPMPLTGYTVTVRRQETVDLPMSIDDAFRFTVSGGVILPHNLKLTQQEIERARAGKHLPAAAGMDASDASAEGDAK